MSTSMFTQRKNSHIFLGKLHTMMFRIYTGKSMVYRNRIVEHKHVLLAHLTRILLFAVILGLLIR